jgi:acetyl-CoA carboxylase carboxyl transferase subunit beta
VDALGFQDRMPYPRKLTESANSTGVKEAMRYGTGTVEGRAVVFGTLEFRFLGGSMGVVVGEKVTRAVELARDRGLPLVLVSASGGARMHEGILSLMQMAKTCAAIQSLNEAGGFSVCVMTHPTTGGVTASFASVTDVILAEPGALIGFAGPRVIATTLRQELPRGFQRAEFLLDRGMIDAIVPRGEMRAVLAKLIDYSGGPRVAADTLRAPARGERA